MFAVREMESTMPICASNMISEEPPYEKNGSEIPVLGSQSVITRMLSTT